MEMDETSADSSPSPDSPGLEFAQPVLFPTQLLPGLWEQDLFIQSQNPYFPSTSLWLDPFSVRAIPTSGAIAKGHRELT